MNARRQRKLWWIPLIFAPRTVVYAVIFVLFALKAIGTLDPDFGWHLRSGQYIIEHGVPVHDIFTYTARDFPWIHHEWLADVVSAFIYGVGGYWLLGLLFALLWTTSIWLVARNNPLPVVTLVGVCAMLSFSGVRAVTWTVFFCAILYEILRRKGWVRLAILPLMLLWANIHGGFIVGLAYIGWKMLAERSLPLLAILLGAMLMTFITPYGGGMYVEIWRTLADRELHGNIQEWSSFALTIPAVVITGVWVGARAVTASTWWRAVVSFETLLLLGTVSSIRNLPLFCLFALAWLADIIARQSIDTRMLITRLKPIGMQLSIAVVAMMVVMGAGVYDALRGFSFNPEQYRPRSIVRSLQTYPCKGNLFNSYNIGGYLIWRLPGTPVYIDGRMPSWEHNGNKYMKTYREVLGNSTVQQREFARYTVTCVAVEADSDLAKRLQREGWRRELTDAGYVLFRRSAV